MSRSCSAGRLGHWEGGNCGVPSNFLLSSLSQSDSQARHRACPERHLGGCPLLGVSCWSCAGSSLDSSAVAVCSHVLSPPGAEESPLESLGPERKLEGQSLQPRSPPISPWPAQPWSLPNSGCGSGGVSAEGGTRCCEIITNIHLEKTYLLQHFFTGKKKTP